MDIQPVAFDSPEVTGLIDGWYEELAETVPGFDRSGGSAVDPAEFSARDGLFLIASDSTSPIGCGGLRRFDAATGEIKRLFVRREHRGRGVARALLERLEDAADGLGYQALYLDTTGEPAATVFRRAGYREIAPFNDNPYARFWFSKSLPG